MVSPNVRVASQPTTSPHECPSAPFCRAQDPKVTEDRAFNGFGTNFENSSEPIYGTQFLPRKFKVAVTVPGDNSVDLFTNDLGVVVICDDQGELQASGWVDGRRAHGRSAVGCCCNGHCLPAAAAQATSLAAPSARNPSSAGLQHRGRRRHGAQPPQR
jgi:hypothetical protein